MEAVFVLCLAAAANGLAQDHGPAKSGAPERNTGKTLEKMPPSLEIRFALSALPPSLRDKAAVYVLDPAKGYVLDHAGSNGQNCFIERTVWQWEEYRNDLYAPMCYDSAGAKSQMRMRFDVAALRAKGLSPEALKKEMEKRYAHRRYKPPDRAGFSYMTAPLMRTYFSLDPSDKTVRTMSMPHVMYYAPNITDASAGTIRPPSPYPYLFEPGPLGFFIQRLGAKETAKIVANESALLGDLCSYRSYLCLKISDTSHPASESPK